MFNKEEYIVDFEYPQPCFKCGYKWTELYKTFDSSYVCIQCYNPARNLLVTQLTTEKSEIVYWVGVLSQYFLKYDINKLEISDDEIIVDSLVFVQEGDGWVAGYMEEFGGSYWQPPDYDFVSICRQQNLTIPNFIANTFIAILSESITNIVSGEIENLMYQEEKRIFGNYLY